MTKYTLCLPLFLVLYASQNVYSAKTTTYEVTKKAEKCDRKAKENDKLFVYYTGYITESGKEFDSTNKDTEPFEFQMGVDEVIKGWDVGLEGMCVGEKRKLSVPAEEGYGAEGTDKVPKNADLTFDVELLKIEDGVAPPDLFAEVDTNGDRKIDRKEMFVYLKKRAEEYGMTGSEFDDQHREVVGHMFEAEDDNKDGVIVHKEFRGPKGKPTEHDEL